MRPATASWLAEARLYRRERLGAWPFAPLVLGLWALGALAVPGLGGATQLLRLAAVAALVCGLRLLDDLADLPRDRQSHPGRVLCQSAHLGCFRGAVGALGAAQAAAALALDVRGARLAVLAGVWLLLGATYAWKRRRGLNPLLNAHLVLAKYPALVLLAWPPAPIGEALAAALPAMKLAYAALLAYEVASDAEVRGALRRPAPLLAECLLLVLLFLPRPWPP